MGSSHAGSFFAMAFPLLSAAASGNHSATNLWVPSTWCSPGCSGLHPRQWHWHSPDSTCVPFFPVYSLWVLDLEWKPPYIMRIFQVFILVASMSLLTNSLYQQSILWLAGHTCWWHRYCSSHLVGSSGLILCWYLDIAVFLAFSSWFPYDCGIPR